MKQATQGKLIVYGGTFDPPHAGHVRCVQLALEHFGEAADRVLVVPSSVAYYKDSAGAAAEDRMEMCRLAFGEIGRVEVSDLDIVRGGVTYTVDTLRDIAEQYELADRPVFVLGTDSARWLHKWKDAEILRDSASFFVVPRGEALDVAILEELRAQGFEIEVAHEVVPEISSTAIREKIAAGESRIEDLPQAVLAYIRKRGLYKADEPAELADVFSEAFLEERRQELRQRVSEYRYNHSIGVAETAVALAKTYGVDERKAYLAGLLHDWDKNFDDEGIRARADQLGVKVHPDVYADAPQTLHGLTAAAALPLEFPELPADVLQAISRHTTGAVGMSDLDMVIFVADALEPNRTSGPVERLRELVGTVSLDDLFIETEAHWISAIIKRKKTLHPDTMEVWNHYAKRISASRGQIVNPDGRPGTARTDEN